MAAQSVAKFFDSYSGNFNAIYGNQNTLLDRLVNTLFRQSIRLRFSKTIEGCDPIEGRTVLDVGCGPGHYAVTLAQKGAKEVCGIDFANRMLDLAIENAERAGVADRCQFIAADFHQYPIQDHFDYVIVMGFMDYARDPFQVIHKALSVTRRKAFFSFPVQGGVLAWQRKLRYKNRCQLFLYTGDQIKSLFAGLNHQKLEIEKISRDFFVSVHTGEDEQLSRISSTPGRSFRRTENSEL